MTAVPSRCRVLLQYVLILVRAKVARMRRAPKVRRILEYIFLVNCTPRIRACGGVQNDSCEGSDNLVSRDERSSQTAADLGFAADAAPVRDREFEDSQSGARYSHLHFEVPAIAQFAHTKLQ